MMSKKTPYTVGSRKGLYSGMVQVGEIIKLHDRSRTNSEYRKNKWKFIVEE